MYKYVNIDSVIEEYLDLTDISSRVPKTYIKKLANDVVKKLVFDKSYRHRIEILPVKDNKARLPESLVKIIQLAYRDETPRKIIREEIIEWTSRYDDCELTISLDCPHCHGTNCSCERPGFIVDVDELWNRSHPELQYGHLGWYYRHGGFSHTNNSPLSFYHPEFSLLKPASSDFFNADYHIKGCLNLDSRLMSNCVKEYRIDPPVIRTNFEEGEILISYLEARVDDEGYRLIPDIPDLFDAIKWYIEAHMLYRDYRRSRQRQDLILFQNAERLKDQAFARTRGKLDEYEVTDLLDFLSQHHSNIIRYNHYHENMNRRREDPYDANMNRLTNHR